MLHIMTDDTKHYTLDLLHALQAAVLTVKEKMTAISHHVMQLRIASANSSLPGRNT